jgi:hypothetical protein
MFHGAQDTSPRCLDPLLSFDPGDFSEKAIDHVTYVEGHSLPKREEKY